MIYLLYTSRPAQLMGRGVTSLSVEALVAAGPPFSEEESITGFSVQYKRAGDPWQPALHFPIGQCDPWQPALHFPVGECDPWQPALHFPIGQCDPWRISYSSVKTLSDPPYNSLKVNGDRINHRTSRYDELKRRKVSQGSC